MQTLLYILLSIFNNHDLLVGLYDFSEYDMEQVVLHLAGSKEWEGHLEVLEKRFVQFAFKRVYWFRYNVRRLYSAS